MSNRKLYWIVGNTGFSMDVGREKETKEIYLVLLDKKWKEDFTSGRQEVTNCFSSDQNFLSITNLKTGGCSK